MSEQKAYMNLNPLATENSPLTLPPLCLQVQWIQRAFAVYRSEIAQAEISRVCLPCRVAKPGKGRGGAEL